MSLPKPDLHVRINADAKARLELLAEVEQVPASVLAGRYIERAVLGEGYALIVAARRLGRAGECGSDGD